MSKFHHLRLWLKHVESTQSIPVHIPNSTILVTLSEHVRAKYLPSFLGLFLVSHFAASIVAYGWLVVQTCLSA